MTRQWSRLNSSDDFNRRLFWSVPSCWFFAESSTLRSVRFSDGKGALLFLYHRNKQDFHSPDIRKDSTISCYEVLYAITSFVLQLFCNDKYYCPVKLFGCIRISSNHARCSLSSILGGLLALPHSYYLTGCPLKCGWRPIIHAHYNLTEHAQ